MRKGGGLVLVCAALGIAMLCGLGIWQVQRLAWKNDLIAKLEARVAATPISVEEAIARAKTGADLEYLRVVVDALPQSHKILLKQTTQNSNAAWQGITGFHTAEGTELLVDLGANETRLTEISGPSHFQALLRKHNLGRGYFDPENNVAANRWHWWDLTAMRDAAGVNAAPDIVFQLVGAHDGSAFEPAEPKVELSNNHLGYAITWFGLAAALAGVAGAFVFGRQRG